MAVLLGTLAAACDPGELITFENDTSEVLFVQINGGGRDRLEPMSNANLGYLWDTFDAKDDPLTIVIADDRGCVVLRVETTLEEFKEKQDSTVTIADLPPRAERRDCDPDLAD